MRKIIFAGLGVLLISLLSLSAPSSWTKEMRKAYMNACVDSASKDMSKKMAKKYCLCTMKKIESLYPDPATISSIPEDVIIRVATECVTK